METRKRTIELRRWDLKGEDEAGRPARACVVVSTNDTVPPAEEATIEYVVTWIRPGDDPESDTFESAQAAKSFGASMAREIAGELHDRRNSTADEIDVSVEGLDRTSVLRRAAEELARLIRAGRAAASLAALQVAAAK